MRLQFFTIGMGILINILAFNYRGSASSRDKDESPLCMRSESEQLYALDYNVKRDLVALQGYSPVSYLENGVAEKGSEEFASTYKNIKYYMTSQDQLQLFERNPDKYMPKYGGYCAFGVLIGQRFDINPENFKLIGEKIYLYKDNDTLELWNSKRSDKRNVIASDAKWQVLKYFL